MRPVHLIALLGLVVVVDHASAASLELAATIPLPDVSGRIDHFALDARRQRLFVAALGNDTVEVVDLAQMKPMKRLDGLKEPQGVAYAAGADRVLVTNGDAGRVDLYAGEDLAKVGSLTVRDDPDNLRYDATAKLAWLGHGSGHDGAIAAIDASQPKLVTDIVIDGHPEGLALESVGPRIFVNVPDRQVVVVVDRVAGAVTATWSLPAASNFPLALDEHAGRLFVGCRSPAVILVLDIATGTVVQRVDGPGDVDDLWYDDATGRLFATGGEGVVTVLTGGGAAPWVVSERIETSGGGRTSFLDTVGRRLFVAIPSGWRHAAELRVFRIR